MNTVFIRWDGHRILCPNSKLSADIFTNITRSQKKGESYRVSPKYPCMSAMLPLLTQSSCILGARGAPCRSAFCGTPLGLHSIHVTGNFADPRASAAQLSDMGD